MKKLSKGWKIFIITTVVLISSIYGYYKINNRNAFEEMYNSYYNLLPLGAIDNMPQIKPIPRDEKHLDSVDLNYKNNTKDVIINIFLVNRENKKKIFLIYSRLIDSGVYLDINYGYDMNTHKLINDITFHGENVPNVDDEKKTNKRTLRKAQYFKRIPTEEIR